METCCTSHAHFLHFYLSFAQSAYSNSFHSFSALKFSTLLPALESCSQERNRSVTTPYILYCEC